MPETLVRIRGDDRVWQDLHKALGAKGFCFLLIFMIASIIALNGALLWFFLLDMVASLFPIDCFERIANCEIISIEHFYNSSESECSDIFTYKWKLPNSAVVFLQRERRRREAEECDLELDVDGRNATFQIGIMPCFRVIDRFEPYIDAFNCAGIHDTKNSSAGPCQTLFTPTSSQDPGVGFWLGLVVWILSVLCVAQSYSD